MADLPEEHWDNKEKLGLRTILGIQILLLIFKIISPYKFGSQFKEDIDLITKKVNEVYDKKL